MLQLNNYIGKFPFLRFTLHLGTGGHMPLLSICLIMNVVFPEEFALNLFQTVLEKLRCCNMVVFKSAPLQSW